MREFWHQGELDGLCGLYSAVNALYYLLPIDEEDCGELFRTGLEHLAVRTNLENTVIGGISLAMLKEILNKFKGPAEKWHYKLSVSPIASDAGNITGVIGKIKKWVQEDNQCVIIGLSGRHEHWSCIAKPFIKSIKFNDSDKLKQIHVCYMTTGSARSKRQHILNQNEVLGLRVDYIP